MRTKMMQSRRRDKTLHRSDRLSNTNAGALRLPLQVGQLPGDSAGLEFFGLRGHTPAAYAARLASIEAHETPGKDQEGGTEEDQYAARLRHDVKFGFGIGDQLQVSVQRPR